jgi:hypothetical protein
MSYSSDCNKNGMMHTNVTVRSKIKVWADDALTVENRYLLGRITKYSCSNNPFTVHTSMGNTVSYIGFSKKNIMPAQHSYRCTGNLVVLLGWYMEFTVSGNSHFCFSQMVSPDSTQQGLSILNFP